MKLRLNYCVNSFTDLPPRDLENLEQMLADTFWKENRTNNRWWIYYSWNFKFYRWDLVGLNKGNYDGLIVKYDVGGNVQWRKTFGGSDYDYLVGVQQTVDGGYLISGRGHSNDGDFYGINNNGTNPERKSTCYTGGSNAVN